MERRPSHPSRATQLKMLGRDPARWFSPYYSPHYPALYGAFLGYRLQLQRKGFLIEASYRKAPVGNGRGFRWHVFARYDDIRVARERAYSDFAQHILEIEG